MNLSSKEEMNEAIHRGWWLAMSGAFDGHRGVVAELARRGHPNPSRWFRDSELVRRIDEVCAQSRAATAPRESGATDDETAVWTLIRREHIAQWNRDIADFAFCHVGTSDDLWLARLGNGGLTRRGNWSEIADAFERDIESDPDPCPYLAYLARFEQRRVRIVGDMAWAAYEVVFPTGDLPHWHGPDIGHEMVVLERHGGQWKIAVFVAIDDQFGQSEAATWEVDAAGRVLRENPAARRLRDSESEVAVRGGRVRIRDEQADKALATALKRLAGLERGLPSVNEAIPVVFDPGNDQPARIWWAGARGGRLFVTTNDLALTTRRLDDASVALGLSPAQHRIVGAIVEGLSLPDAARREGVRLSTARTQLQRVFDKVGVRAQPSLVRALLSAGERP